MTFPAFSLLGRESEIGILDALLDRAPDQGGALILRGDPGIGKSALLTVTRRHAEDRGMIVLSATGVASETHLPYAGLHQVLRPIIGHTRALPVRQRDALLAAFGMADANASDAFLIALATLQLLTDSASRAPLLLIAEDTHWLDGPSCEALTFVSRRLKSEPIVLLASARDGTDGPLENAEFPELRLRGLDRSAAEALLDVHASGLERDLRARLLVEAAGNPLALSELPIASREITAARSPLEWPPLTRRIIRAFASRVNELPTATRTLLLVAAVNDGGSLAETMKAASALAGSDMTITDLAPALSTQLLQFDGQRARFRNPLVRSAVRQTASISQRQGAHRVLAEILSEDPDRRAWHRAGSTIGPDENVASELEASAQRARARGGIPLALRALERSAQLTGDAGKRGGRLLRAAEIAFELGQPDAVVRLLEESEPLELQVPDRRRMRWFKEFLEDASGPGLVAPFVVLAKEMQLGGDTDLAAASLLTAALKCWWSSPQQEIREMVLAAAERLPLAADDPRLLTILAYAAPTRRGAIVIERAQSVVPDSTSDPELMRQLGSALTAVGAFDRSAAFLEASIAGLRAQGRMGLLAQALVSRAIAGIFLGQWNTAILDAAEAGRLAQETAQPRWAASAQLAEATLIGLRGEHDAADRLIAEAERVLLPIAAPPMVALVQMARGAAELGRGHHAGAYEHISRMFDPADVAHHPLVGSWVVSDLVESAVHSGWQDEARAVVRDLEALAQATHSPLLNAGLTYGRPVLADDEHAGPLFQSALSTDLACWPFIRARLLLAHGTWLRRQRRAAESRAPLRAAREAFDALDAPPWAERARQELRASGESSRGRSPDLRDQLTPQEIQVARMAADGMTNREIGQALLLSHRTIGSHLYRIFPKLDVTSRSELSGALMAAGHDSGQATPRESPAPH